MIVHSHDIARTLQRDWTLPNHLCVPVIERLFPDAPTGHSAADTLLWCTGRIDLPRLGHQEKWQWNGTVR